MARVQTTRAWKAGPAETCLVGLFLLGLVFTIAAPHAVHAQSAANRIAYAADRAFADPAAGETRALLVFSARNGAFDQVYGRYRTGYAAETRFVSWSMAKTVTAVAVALLATENRIAVDAPAPVSAWRAPGDPRGRITVRHLLTMTSGLAHQEGREDGRPIEAADTVRMLFTDGAADMARYAASKPLAHEPGTHWQYSTATTHILADIVARAITSATDPMERRRATVRWFAERLWAPLGITSAAWDFDAAGLFLGGSMLHMTAADYARLGRFLFDGGRTPNGPPIIPPAALALLTSKAAARNNNHYAGQLWLNTGPAPGQQDVLFHPRGGADTFALIGHLGQYVVVAPSRRLVIVRLGKSVTSARAAVRAGLADIIDAAAPE